MEKQMTNKQKRELIESNPQEAFRKFITGENLHMWHCFVVVAEKSMFEISKVYSTENSLIASKNAMIAMIQLELI